jgi:hypothetical protein
MKITDIYSRAFNFLARRVIATCFFLGGLVVAGSNITAVFPGGTISVNGYLSSDIFLRTAVVVIPLFMAVVGVLLFRSKPYYPKHDQEASGDGT